MKRSLFEEELVYNMHQALLKEENKSEELLQAINLVSSASEIFEDEGFTTKADELLEVLFKIAKKMHPDRHVKNLTTDKMIKNLKQHGHPLNLADDGSSEDILNADIDLDQDLPIDEDKTFEDD